MEDAEIRVRVFLFDVPIHRFRPECIDDLLLNMTICFGITTLDTLKVVNENYDAAFVEVVEDVQKNALIFVEKFVDDIDNPVGKLQRHVVNDALFKPHRTDISYKLGSRASLVSRSWGAPST